MITRNHGFNSLDLIHNKIRILSFLSVLLDNSAVDEAKTKKIDWEQNHRKNEINRS